MAEYNVENPELGGLVGNRINKHGSPFGLTEEFVEVYRLHSLLPEALRLQRRDGGQEIEEVPFPATRQAGSPKITDRYEMADLFYSFTDIGVASYTTRGPVDGARLIVVLSSYQSPRPPGRQSLRQNRISPRPRCRKQCGFQSRC